MGEKCPHCENGTMRPHGPVCRPEGHKSWTECDGCGYYRGSDYHRCTDDKCEFHAAAG